ncbi:MAG TPA: hypothetical protein VLJ61_10065 [Pyrinomonadaceae bacterium]|nr:hypothetical protein [Pyrinomonadaceae bacterium]
MSTATPTGESNSASAAAPSLKPALPSPAMVVTCPSGEIFRTRLLPVSAT